MSATVKGAIIGGCVGIVVMFVIIESGIDPSLLVTVLWPSSAVGVEYQGQGGAIGLVVGAIEVGVQFLLYAVPGAMVGWVVGRVGGRR
ncbi:MAG: hypothetical protein WBY53_03500 [Acidobacteriaceae bacterium]